MPIFKEKKGPFEARPADSVSTERVVNYEDSEERVVFSLGAKEFEVEVPDQGKTVETKVVVRFGSHSYSFGATPSPDAALLLRSFKPYEQKFITLIEARIRELTDGKPSEAQTLFKAGNIYQAESKLTEMLQDTIGQMWIAANES